MFLDNTRLLKGLRDIGNFFYVRKVIKKNIGGAEWQSHNLRADWVSRIYTVINLKQEDAGEMEQVRQAKIVMKLKPINDYLRSLELDEVIYPSVEKVNDLSYLVVYSPYFTTLTLWFLVKLLLVCGFLLIGLPIILI